MMTDGKYILNDKGEPVLETDLVTWANWFETSGPQRRVGFDKIGDHEISTVFLGMDHGFGDDVPILYETMVFRPVTREEIEEDQKKESPYQIGFKEGYTTEDDSFELRRYHTKKEAEVGHREVVELVKQRS